MTTHWRHRETAPQFTPADRLEALHRVATAARELLSGSAAVLVLEDLLRILVAKGTHRDLERAIERLDAIERYLGRGGP